MRRELARPSSEPPCALAGRGVLWVLGQRPRAQEAPGLVIGGHSGAAGANSTSDRLANSKRHPTGQRQCDSVGESTVGGGAAPGTPIEQTVRWEPAIPTPNRRALLDTTKRPNIENIKTSTRSNHSNTK